MTSDVIGPIEAMDAAFAGHCIDLVDHAGAVQPMALRRWRGSADTADRALLIDRCHGHTIDLGCGPGRMVEGLAAVDVPAFGIDISPEAVRQTLCRGVPAILRDVFSPVPGEGRWDCALLADGNIGIGGSPARLLRRVHQIVSPGGRLVVELDPEGTDVVYQRWRLRIGRQFTPAFDWALVGLDAIERLAKAAGFVAVELATLGDRHAAVLRKAGL